MGRRHVEFVDIAKTFFKAANTIQLIANPIYLSGFGTLFQRKAKSVLKVSDMQTGPMKQGS